MCVCVCLWKRRRARFQPIMDIGFLAKRSRPRMPTYLLRQPADQRRTKYSIPKNTTRTISCQRDAGGKKTEKWPRRTGGKVTQDARALVCVCLCVCVYMYIKKELMFLKDIWCKTTRTSVLTKCTLTTCQNNLLRINGCFSTDAHSVAVQPAAPLSRWIIPDWGCRSNSIDDGIITLYFLHLRSFLSIREVNLFQH